MAATADQPERFEKLLAVTGKSEYQTINNSDKDDTDEGD